MKPLYKRYENERPCATWYGGGAWFGANIYAPLDEDKCDCDFVASWWQNEGECCFYRHTVRYTPSGRPFFMKSGNRIYLDECIRTDI